MQPGGSLALSPATSTATNFHIASDREIRETSIFNTKFVNLTSHEQNIDQNKMIVAVKEKNKIFSNSKRVFSI